MALLDRVKATNSGQKAIGMADIVKLNGKISENERKIKQIYAEIGETYCNTHADNAEEELAEQVSTVRDLKAQIESFNDQIQTLRGLVKCPACGKYVANNAPFCTFCGSRILSEKAIVCTNCGAVTEHENVKFCQKCGNPLPNRSADSQPQPQKKRCSNCGAELEDGAAFCMNCGTPIDGAASSRPSDTAPGKKICPHCGAEQDLETLFCMECGTRLS